MSEPVHLQTASAVQFTIGMLTISSMGYAHAAVLFMCNALFACHPLKAHSRNILYLLLGHGLLVH